MTQEKFLEKILATKKREVEEKRALVPVKMLEKSVHFPVQTVSFSRYLKRADLSGIIAEIKRRSPSKGFINKYISVEKLSIGYMQAGASALSILTDETYFAGSNEDLLAARRYNFCPILRKDFVIDEYQVIEAKSIGADVILLIAAALSPREVKRLSELATSLGLEVLLEIHEEAELDHLCEELSVVGVNNRDLKTFNVSVATSKNLGPKIPHQFVKISESGISSAHTIQELREVGFKGFLIGEAFMSASDPAEACRDLIRQLRE
jgi:indole-3-glycerol phosphate synthase